MQQRTMARWRRCVPFYVFAFTQYTYSNKPVLYLMLSNTMAKLESDLLY